LMRLYELASRIDDELRYFIVFFFFFSSRRRHTRCYRDWSSDVCSSDLICKMDSSTCTVREPLRRVNESILQMLSTVTIAQMGERSEERRVGKECRCGWSEDACKRRER